MCAQEAGAEISMIKTLLRKIKFEVRLKLVRGHEDPTGQCNTQRLKYLIKECDLKASKARENVLSNEITTNIACEPFQALLIKCVLAVNSNVTTRFAPDAHDFEAA